jgi:hypothetical protein
VVIEMLGIIKGFLNRTGFQTCESQARASGMVVAERDTS